MAEKKYLDSGGLTTLTGMIKTKVEEVANKKQDKLVSGTNIKTVGGNSLLGSGNISVGVTGVGTGAGLIGGTITSTGTIKCNLASETSLGTIGTTPNLYAVGVDSKNKLGVNVPTVTTTTDGLMSATDKTNLNSAVSKLSGIASGAEVNQNAFSNVKVGSTTIAADAKQDTVEFVAGDNITIETDASADKISISAKDTTYSAATTSAAGLMSAADKTNLNNAVSKLSGIASGAEVNQNAFSNVKVGSTTIAADAKQDTVEFVSGSNITITADADTDKISISAKDTTYNEATISAAGLMSATDKVALNNIATKIDSIASGAEVNQNAFSNVKVGSTTVAADTKQDTVEFVSGTNITITADAATDKISISTSAEVNQNAFSNVKVGSTTIAADAKQDTVEFVAGTNVTITADADTDKISISAKDTTYSAATTSTAGLMSATDKVALNNIATKIDGIASGAEVNQNAFSNVKVEVGDDSTTIAADTKTDTLTLVAGDNITIETDTATDKISISAKDTTYSAATTSAAGLMSAADKTNLNSAVSKLSGIASGAEVNQNAFSNVKVGSTTVAADAKQDTVEFVAGTNVTITADAATDKISISTSAEVNQNAFSNVKVGSTTIAADAKQDTVEFVSGPNITIDADVDNDKISINHTEEGPSSGYTSSNTTTSISGSGGSGTIKIPQLTVDKYGHVTAAADENVTITIPTIPTTLKNPKSLKFGSKSYDGSTEATITAADLGLASALKYHGTTTTAISDGSTTNPIVIGGSNHTAAQGCVVAYGKKEFVWTGSAWEELGNEGNYKVVQTAVSSPSASGSTTAFIDTISQDTNGKITVTKKNVSFPSFPSLDPYVTGLDNSTVNHIAVFNDTSGKVIKDSGFTIGKSVPSNAVFTDTNTKVTSVDNHYTPDEDTEAAISASSGTATNITGTSGKLNVVTGLKRDAKGHITGVTSANIYSTDNNSTYANYSFGNGHATCATTEATTAKVATYSNYSKQHGGIVAVKFTYAVPANSTLNINSKGAHDIYYNGAKITAGIIGAGDTALFVYDSSTGYVLLSTQVVTKARLGAHKHAYTPAGSVSSTFTGTAHNHTFTGTAATSGEPSKTTSVYSITGVGSLPSCTLPVVKLPTITMPTCTLPSTTVEYSNGELSITHNAGSYSNGSVTAGSVTAGSFSAGSLPTRSSVTVASSDHTHSVTATGTIANTTATGTIANTTATGTIASTFTGTAGNATTIS